MHTYLRFLRIRLNALERNRRSGKDILKRLEVIVRFPEVGLYLLIMNGGILQQSKFDKAKKNLLSLVEQQQGSDEQ